MWWNLIHATLLLRYISFSWRHSHIKVDNLGMVWHCLDANKEDFSVSMSNFWGTSETMPMLWKLPAWEEDIWSWRAQSAKSQIFWGSQVLSNKRKSKTNEPNNKIKQTNVIYSTCWYYYKRKPNLTSHTWTSNSQIMFFSPDFFHGVWVTRKT